MQMLNRKNKDKNDDGGDDDGDDDNPMSPGTAENYRRIDEQYATAVHQGTVSACFCF